MEYLKITTDTQDFPVEILYKIACEYRCTLLYGANNYNIYMYLRPTFCFLQLHGLSPFVCYFRTVFIIYM